MADKIILRTASLLLEASEDGTKDILQGIPMMGTDKALVREFDKDNNVQLTYIYQKNAEGRSVVRFVEPWEEYILLNTPAGALHSSIGRLIYSLDVKKGILSFSNRWVVLRGEEMNPGLSNTPWLVFTSDFSAERQSPIKPLG